MDPITLLITAIVAGAVAATEKTAAQAIKDAYAGLKALLASRFQTAKTAVDVIEADPQAADLKQSAETLLKKSGADKDVEVLTQAQAVLQAVEKSGLRLAPALGVDMQKVRIGASLTMEDIVASGTGVKLGDVEVKEDVIIKGVRAGQQGSAPNH